MNDVSLTKSMKSFGEGSTNCNIHGRILVSDDGFWSSPHIFLELIK